MADVKWTNEQMQAIETKGSNILVAAAAGSGKTAVLVERIISKVINDKVDIDRILVVTFTNAAASEMRERILEAIYKKIEENPEDNNLQRQVILLNKSNICTIDSFCKDVIKNNFYEINASANFRVGDKAEIELLKQEVIDDLFDEKYENKDSGFIKLINTYTGYQKDDKLKELILKIYGFIQANPTPNSWLNEKVEMFNLKDSDMDFAQTPWGKILLQEVVDNVFDTIVKLKNLEGKLQKFDELFKYKCVINEDIQTLESIIKNSDNWNNVYNIFNPAGRFWATWPADRKITNQFKDEAKELRDSAKKKIDEIKKKYFIFTSEQAKEDIYQMYDILNEIKNIIIEFSEKFLIRKREKNIIDFNDMEHFALNILVKYEDGKPIPTEVAKNYQQKFDEIAIDEYQDSNLVQETILNSVSKGNNVFMVGDVKQSIYQFRQARPKLFLEKYAKYSSILEIEEKPGNCSQGLKIKLFKNFRSRKNILDVTNIIFENIMSESLGSINYDESEFLNLGAQYENPEEKLDFAGIAELHIIDEKEQEEDKISARDRLRNDAEQESENKNVEKNIESENKNFEMNLSAQSQSADMEENECDTEEQEEVEKTVLEAKFVANKIKQLLNSNYNVWDKKQKKYRKVTYKDIVVLLRATTVPAPIYEQEIAGLEIPVYSDASAKYLDSYEIQVIMSLLKIIDNPMQDIPLITVMRSSIGGFTDNELIEIRLFDSGVSFYQTLMKCQPEGNLKNKVNKFLQRIKTWQEQERYMALDELIWQIYQDTGFYNYVSLMQNGALRQANLKMLFERAKQYESVSFKGLFNFINFIDKLQTSSGDLSPAKIIGESENVVRIMSIHKSKGLEFPVVYLCGTGKKFNMQDLNENIILHQDLGFGPKYVNEEIRIEYPTLAKEALKMQIKNELISEEMRVLYVALTRAKEKLIVTGVSKNVEKSLNDKEKILETYRCVANLENRVSDKILKKYISYLDWIQLVYLKDANLQQNMSMKVYKKSEILKQLLSDESEETSKVDFEINVKLQEVDEKQINEVKQLMGWKYNYVSSSMIPTKTSVTKIKQMQNEYQANMQNIKFNQSEHENSICESPKFLAEEEKITGAQKGTLMHMCFQKLNHNKNYEIEDLNKFVLDLVTKEIISVEEAKNININKLYQFTKSELWQQLKKAKKVYKEAPFYLNINSKEVYNDESNEQILVQGVIDLYFIDENGELILVDYKTDYVETEQQLIDKYAIQLDMYKRALEAGINMQVSKKYIYSVKLEKLIKI